jgi:branched-chain amino acid transport system permease protein
LDLPLILNQLISGLTLGAAYFMVGVGLSLVFGVCRVANNAHGSFYIVGLYLCYTFNRLAGSTNFGFLLAIILGPVVVAVFAGLIEVSAIRRIYPREPLMQFILTFAFLYILADVVRLIWGPLPLGISVPEALTGLVFVGGVIIPHYSVFFSILAAVVGIALWVLLNRTKFGWLVNAAASDAEMTAAIGIDVSRVLTVVFMMGGFLGGLAGVAYAPLSGALLGQDLYMTILAFVVVVCAGIGSVGGAAVLGLMMGMINAVGLLILPQYALVFIYALMLVVMLFRPNGLFARIVL